MKTYIKNKPGNQFLAFEENLNTSMYAVGTTFADYINGKFVELTEEQLAFHNAHPEASAKEVFDMQLREETIEEAKQNKIREIEMYDSSAEVNQFIYNGEGFWLDKATRVGLVNSTTMQQKAGMEQTTLWLGDYNVTLPCETILNMLGALELYAFDCYNVTASHINEVKALKDIEAVRGFDITTGYPHKLNF